MRLSATERDAFLYRVYDYPAGVFRKDLCWADDELNQVGVGCAFNGCEYVRNVEQRKRVLIIIPLKWVALDLPEEEEKVRKKEPVLTSIQTRERA